MSIGIATTLWNIKCKRRKLKSVNEELKKEINQRRAKLGIRSIEKEVDLFNKIVEIENLKVRKHDGLKRTGNLFLSSLFIQMMP